MSVAAKHDPLPPTLGAGANVLGDIAVESEVAQGCVEHVARQSDSVGESVARHVVVAGKGGTVTPTPASRSAATSICSTTTCRRRASSNP
jgi:hypothetical protein